MFDISDFYINLSSYVDVNFAYGDGDALDPSATGGGHEITWLETYDPNFLNGGAFDFFTELYQLISDDPIVAEYIDNAAVVYVGDFVDSFNHSVSMGNYDAFLTYWYHEGIFDFSHQYTFDKVSGGYIKEYV
jgi:hypothetical protein